MISNNEEKEKEEKEGRKVQKGMDPGRTRICLVANAFNFPLECLKKAFKKRKTQISSIFWPHLDPYNLPFLLLLILVLDFHFN